MERFLRLKKLNQVGFDHVLVAVAVVLIIGVGGTYYLLGLHAATSWSGALKSGLGNYCMDDNGAATEGTELYLNKCSGTGIDQKWELNPTGGTIKYNGATKDLYEIENYNTTANECVDNWQGDSTPGGTNYVRLYPCNSAHSDKAQIFYWMGSDDNQLKNEATGLCIDVSKASTATNTHLDMYTCKTSGISNQQWTETSNSAGSPTQVTPPTTGSAAEIQSTANTCLTQSGSTISFTPCDNASVQKWSQVVGTTNTQQFINSSTHAYLATANGKKLEATTTNNTQSIWTAFSVSGGDALMTGVNSGDLCLEANGSTASLATCNTSASDQIFTLPVPYTGSGDLSQTVGAGAGASDANQSQTNQSQTNQSQTNQSQTGGGSNDSGTNATANSAYVAMFEDIKDFDPGFQCSTLPTNQGTYSSQMLSACDSAFGQ